MGIALRMQARSNPVIALIRLLAITAMSAVLYFLYLIRQLPLRRPEQRFAVVPKWVSCWARMVAKLGNIRVTASTPPPATPVVLCPNHLGYADILALASVTHCFFVTRSDAADWPLLGPMIRVSEQVLVSRKKSRDLAETSDKISCRLQAQQTVCIFLEGTSTGGDRVLPFFPGLLKPAIESGVQVVPTAITWSSNQPDLSVSEDIAYWGDHNIVPHLWRFLGLGRKEVQIEFGRARTAANRDRKELAQELRAEILKMKGFPPD